MAYKHTNMQIYYTNNKNTGTNLHQMCFLVGPLRSGHSERHEELADVVDDLDPAEDGEAGEESHGATNEAELGLQGYLYVSLYLVIGGRVEVNLD